MQTGIPKADRPADWPRRARAWLASIGLVVAGGILGSIWWGMTGPPVLATIRPQHVGAALVVPVSAVRNLNPKHGSPSPPHVFVIERGIARRTDVHPGRVQDGTVEILGGIGADALLVADPPLGLEDGHRVVARP